MSNRILSYKGMLASGQQDTILLSTNKGEKGYRIIKLEVISSLPATTTQESIVKIFKVDDKAIDETIDFSDNTLLGAAFFEGHSNTTTTGHEVIVFDQEIFNQDIYIMGFDGSGGNQPINYYLELEVIKLSEDQAMVATLKDIRNNS
jgi:hypothetical protein